MNRRWLVLAAVIAILVLGSGTIAFARYGHGRGGYGWHGEWAMARMEARLKLTPDQSRQMREIVSSQKLKLFDQFSAGRDNRQALIKEIFKDNPNQAEIQKRVAAIQQQHSDMLNQVVAAGTQLNKVLTPEQRVEMQKVIDERMQAGEKMRQRMRERRAQHQTETTPK